MERAAAVPAAGKTPLVRTDALVKTYQRGRRFTWSRRFGVIPWPTAVAKPVHALDRVCLSIERGEVLGLVGESGSGKSTLGRTILDLIEPTAGTVRFDGQDIGRASAAERFAWRKRAQIVFQNPDSSLNPRRRIGHAIARAVSLHRDVPPRELRGHVEALIDRVGLPRAYYDRYPHQLSGGEKQRVGIARAIATEPDFIVCDEPVSALDVSVQATVLNLLDELRRDLGLSYLFISHDLSVVAYVSDRIAVMYSGRICEIGPTDAVLRPPYHPYTRALLSAVPNPASDATADDRVRLRGERPPGAGERAGCIFNKRCPDAIQGLCEASAPPVLEPSPGHRIACHLPLAELMSRPSAVAPAIGAAA